MLYPYKRRKTVKDGGQRYVVRTHCLRGQFGFMYEHEGREYLLPAAVIEHMVSQRKSLGSKVESRVRPDVDRLYSMGDHATVTVEYFGGVQKYVIRTRASWEGGATTFDFMYEHEGREYLLPAAVLDRFVSQRDSIQYAVDVIGQPDGPV